MSSPAPRSDHTARSSWFARQFSGLRFDLVHALRQLRKAPGFAAVTLLTLALCIGANTAIFSLVYALMLKPLPYAEPERIVEVYNTFAKAGLEKLPSSVPQLVDYRTNARSYASLGLWSPTEAMLGDPASGERLSGARATAGIFDVLQLRPVVGQFFTNDHSRPNEDRVVVLTHALWQSKFGRDPGVVGSSVLLEGEPHTVLGVAPRELEAFNAQVRFLRPIAWPPQAENPQARFGLGPALFARLQPGVSVGEAQAEAVLLEKRYYDAAPPGTRDFLDRSGHKIAVGGVQVERIRPMRTALLLLQGGVLFVLLIGCVNVANLLLARANARQAELAVRCALGATRGAIARQMLTESLLITSAGALIGLGVALGTIALINGYIARAMPSMPPVPIDGGVLGFTVLLAVAAAVFIGIIPTFHVLRTNLMELIHRNSRGASGSAGVRAMSSALVIGQVAVALVLLTGAALLIHSFAKALAVRPGFEPGGLIAGQVTIPGAHRRTDEAARAVRDRLLAAMREIPGVEAAAYASGVPFKGELPVNAFTLADDTLAPGAAQPSAYRVIVSPDYFATLRLSPLEGRFLEPGDAEPGRRVFVVDEAFAQRYFPGRSAVGGRFAFGNRPEKDSDWPTIVGVVRNVPHNGVEDRSGVPFVYHLQTGRPGGVVLFARSERVAAELLPLMREKLRTIDPAIQFHDAGPLTGFIADSHRNRRAVMLLLGSFAGLALFLSALGLYGVLAYDVTQRTREIGIRGALGATRGEIIGLVLRQGMWKTGVGLGAGLVGAVLLSGTLKTMLFDLTPTDPLAYGVVSLVLLGTAGLASYLPARRAAAIDPMAALRVE